MTREFDIVLLGATGFTGSLTARYLADQVPPGARWAVAGRSAEKLSSLSRWLGSEVPVVLADVTDPVSLAELAARSRVLISTVGPYLEYGEPVVRACADAGTDYLDLTGEPEFIDRMYLTHHATAVRSGARLIHAAGFDSIPHDLGAYFTVKQLGGVAEPLVLRGVVRVSAGFSGGTLHSALGQFARGRGVVEAARARRRLEPAPSGRSSRAVTGRPGRDGTLGLWLVPLPLIDQTIIARSGAALASYGPAFSYSHFAGTKTLRYAAGGAALVGAVATAAQVGALRERIGRRLAPGEGPSADRRARSWFTVDFLATTGSRTLRTRVSGGDPGYTETSKMLAESALCLAFDDNPPTAGQVTTATAMGDALLARLQAAGIGFEVR